MRRCRWRRFWRALPSQTRLAFVGDGVPAYEETLRRMPNACVMPANVRDLRADAACVLAAARRQTWVQARELKPYYLRLPQAERERLAREEERR